MVVSFTRVALSFDSSLSVDACNFSLFRGVIRCTHATQTLQIYEDAPSYGKIGIKSNKCCFDGIVWGLYQSKYFTIVVVIAKWIVLISNTISHIENVVL